jgi:hypothetical protein
MPLSDVDRIKRGRDFEKSIAARGGRARPGSGNKWNAKGDVVLGPLLLSAKAEARRSWGRTRRQYSEAVEMAQGTGLLPALAIKDDDDVEFVILSLDDLVGLLGDEVSMTVARLGRQTRRTRADTPSLLRDTTE